MHYHTITLIYSLNFSHNLTVLSKEQEKKLFDDINIILNILLLCAFSNILIFSNLLFFLFQNLIVLSPDEVIKLFSFSIVIYYIISLYALLIV